MDVAGTIGTLRQEPAALQHSGGWDDWEATPRVTERQLVPAAGWRRIDGAGDVDASGTLIGGCIETVSRLAGTPFGDPAPLDGPHLVYLEAAEENAYSICRALHGMRLNGFFAQASAILIGRTSAPDSPTLTQDGAVLDALGVLGVPIIAGMDIGHVPPQAQLINGATARVVFTGDANYIGQHLGQ
jgi:muramoyltetrapeptide carboxypeptidase